MAETALERERDEETRSHRAVTGLTYSLAVSHFELSLIIN